MSQTAPRHSPGDEVREVTDEEVQLYEKQGWVWLDSLITPELATEMRDAAERLLADAREAPEGIGKRKITLTDSMFSAGKMCDEQFQSLSLSKELGRVAHRLMNRSRLTDEVIGVRYLEDVLWCKFPGAASSTYHQDLVVGHLGGFNIWIALDEVTPKQGAMRFLTGSHREVLASKTKEGPATEISQIAGALRVLAALSL